MEKMNGDLHDPAGNRNGRGMIHVEKISVTIILHNVTSNQRAVCKSLAEAEEAFKEVSSKPQDLFLIIASEDGQVDFAVYLGYSEFCYYPDSLEETIRANIEEFRDAPEPPSWRAIDSSEDWAYQWALLGKVIDRIEFT